MCDMLEYLFFTRPIADQFIQKLENKKIPWQESAESVHSSILIQVTEDDIGEYWDEIDDLYDDMAIEDQEALEKGDIDETDVSTAGVYIQLKNGEQTIAQVKPDVLNRILGAITSDEFSEFIDTIAKSIESPDETSICKRQNLFGGEYDENLPNCPDT